jgi:hypothetical protein
MQTLVEIGPHAPAGQTGAKYIIRKDGRRVNLAFMRDGASTRLEVGLMLFCWLLLLGGLEKSVRARVRAAGLCCPWRQFAARQHPLMRAGYACWHCLSHSAVSCT